VTTLQTVGSLGPALPARDERLQQVVGQLQGVFVEQLFKAMRETVPTDGGFGGGSGEAMFNGLLDQHLSGAVPGQWEQGIGEAMLRQLRPRLLDVPTAASAAPVSPLAGKE